MKARVSNFFGFGRSESGRALAATPAARAGVYEEYEVTLAEGPLGLSLHTVAKCGGLSSSTAVRALETAAAGGAGQAEAAGVGVGDVLVRVAGEDVRALAFDGVMEVTVSPHRSHVILHQT